MTEYLDFYNEKLKSATTIAELFSMNHRVVSCRKAGISRLNTTTLLPGDITERIKLWLNNDIHWATCGFFCKKDFMVTNQISYPDMNVCEDQILAFECLCLAKKYLHASNIIYIQRKRMDSISNVAVDAEKFLHKWLSSLNVGFNEFDKVMRRVTFFDNHPDYRYAVLNWFFNRVIADARQIPAAYAKVHPAALNQLIEKEFHVDDAALAAYLFNTVNTQRLQILQLQTENNALKKSLTQK